MGSSVESNSTDSPVHFTSMVVFMFVTPRPRRSHLPGRGYSRPDESIVHTINKNSNHELLQPTDNNVTCSMCMAFVAYRVDELKYKTRPGGLKRNFIARR